MNTVVSNVAAEGFGFKLTEEQEMIRQMTAEFADKEIKPFAGEWDIKDHVPMDVLKKMHDLVGHASFFTRSRQSS